MSRQFVHQRAKDQRAKKFLPSQFVLQAVSQEETNKQPECEEDKRPRDQAVLETATAS